RSGADYAIEIQGGFVTTADFNHDGRLDLAVASAVDDSIAVLLGDDVRGFTAPAKYATARAPRKILVGDFNTDGKLDMAVGADAGVSLLLGDGVGGFATVSAVPTGFATQSGLAAGDFNNDGKLDLAGVSNISDVVTIFLGDGAGHFSAPSTYAILS